MTRKPRAPRHLVEWQDGTDTKDRPFSSDVFARRFAGLMALHGVEVRRFERQGHALALVQVHPKSPERIAPR